MRRSLPPLTWETEDLSESQQMRRLWEKVLEDTGHPPLVQFLAGLIDVARVPPRDPVRLARAIQLYAARHVKFFRERPERFQQAARTIAWGIGDCDDKARLVAALLRTARVPARLTFMHMVLPGNKHLGHVFPEAWLTLPAHRAGWIPLESVREYPMGYNPIIRARERGFVVTTHSIGDAPGDQTHI